MLQVCHLLVAQDSKTCKQAGCPPGLSASTTHLCSKASACSGPPPACTCSSSSWRRASGGRRPLLSDTCGTCCACSCSCAASQGRHQEMWCQNTCALHHHHPSRRASSRSTLLGVMCRALPWMEPTSRSSRLPKPASLRSSSSSCSSVRLGRCTCWEAACMQQRHAQVSHAQRGWVCRTPKHQRAPRAASTATEPVSCCCPAATDAADPACTAL